MKSLLQNPGISFLIKFILLFAFFYVGTQVVIGLCAEVGWYSPFIAKHANYIAWLRGAILKGGHIAASLIGLNTIIRPPFVLQLVGGPAVKMVYSCIGVGVMSIWVAFVLANKASIIKKLLWTLGGLLTIWFINSWRIALLLYTLHQNGNINKFAEHHTFFNTISYIIILALMYFFTRKNPLQSETSTKNSSARQPA